MSDSSPTPTPDPTESVAKPVPSVSPFKTLVGAALAGIMVVPLWRLTSAIAESFAAHPLHTTNQITINISVAVRTLVVGLGTLATGVFAIVTLGLLGLTLQLVIQVLLQNPSDVESSES